MADTPNNHIYAADYASVPVLEFVTADGDFVLRRKSDSYVNIQHIFNIAGVSRSKTKQLIDANCSKETIDTVVGNWKYQGTYVPLHEAEKIAKDLDVYALIQPIFDADVSQDLIQIQDSSLVPARGEIDKHVLELTNYPRRRAAAAEARAIKKRKVVVPESSGEDTSAAADAAPAAPVAANPKPEPVEVKPKIKRTPKEKKVVAPKEPKQRKKREAKPKAAAVEPAAENAAAETPAPTPRKRKASKKQLENADKVTKPAKRGRPRNDAKQKAAAAAAATAAAKPERKKRTKAASVAPGPSLESSLYIESSSPPVSSRGNTYADELADASHVHSDIANGVVSLESVLTSRSPEDQKALEAIVQASRPVDLESSQRIIASLYKENLALQYERKEAESRISSLTVNRAPEERTDQTLARIESRYPQQGENGKGNGLGDDIWQLKTDVRTLASRLSGQKSIIDSLKLFKRNNNLIELNTRLIDENTALKQKVQDLEAAKVSSHVATSVKEKFELAQLEAEYSRESERLDDVITQHPELKEKVASLPDSDSLIKSYRQLIETRLNFEIEKSVSQLLEDHNRVSKRNVSLEGKVSDLKVEVEDLKDEILNKESLLAAAQNEAFEREQQYLEVIQMKNDLLLTDQELLEKYKSKEF